jgi:hypothetical protein
MSPLRQTPDDDAQPSIAGRLGAIGLPLLILLALAGGVAANGGLRALLAQAIHRIDPRAVLVVLPVQLLAILLCTGAQQALRMGVPFRTSFVARLVRDAAHNLLIFPPGLGEAVGARVLVLAGGRPRAAVSLRALDIAAEVLAELPYMGLAFWVLARFWAQQGEPGLTLTAPSRIWLGVALVAISGVVLARRWWRKHGRTSRLARRARAEALLMRREMRRQKAGLPLAIILHFFAWGLSGVQVWLAAGVFGLHLSLFGALAIESAATSARMILFFVPGGLVMQEAGAVLAGAALGVPAAPALALSLVLRLRDVVFGAALLLWPWLEYRARRARRR